MSETIKNIFGDRKPDLYLELDLKKESKPTPNEIKKAYHKLALKYHPDKNNEKSSNEKFQKVSMAYKILSDEESKKMYDEYGILEGFEMKNIEDMFNDLFERVTWEALAEDKLKYQGSNDELNDLKVNYDKYDGDLDLIFGSIPHASVLEDEERFINILNDEINKGNLKSSKKFNKTTTKVSRKSRNVKAQKEAEEAEELRKELGLGDDFINDDDNDEDDEDEDDEAIANSSLAKLIKQRTQKREDELNNVVNSIESKYLKPSKSKKSKGKEKEKATSSKNKKRIAESDEDNDDKKHEESDETKRPNNKKKKN